MPFTEDLSNFRGTIPGATQRRDATVPWTAQTNGLPNRAGVHQQSPNMLDYEPFYPTYLPPYGWFGPHVGFSGYGLGRMHEPSQSRYTNAPTFGRGHDDLLTNRHSVEQAGFPSGQARLPSGQAGLPSGQAGLPSGQAGLPSGQAGFPSGHDQISPYELSLRPNDRLQLGMHIPTNHLFTELELRQYQLESRVGRQFQSVVEQQAKIEHYMSTMSLRQEKTDKDVSQVVERQVKLDKKQEETAELLKTVLGQTTMIIDHLKSVPAKSESSPSPKDNPAVVVTNPAKPEPSLSPKHIPAIVVTSHPVAQPHSNEHAHRMTLNPDDTNLRARQATSMTVCPEAPPEQKVSHLPSVPNTSSSTEPKKNAALIDKWVDGPFLKTFPWDQFNFERGVDKPKILWKRFFSHWSMCYPGGKRSNGAIDATEPEEGYKTRRFCTGVLTCPSGDCRYIKRAAVTKKGLEEQAEMLCTCGSKLKHIRCEVVHKLSLFEGGVQFEATNRHDHPRPPPKHLTVEEKTKFQKLVVANPNATPLTFITGVPGPDGTSTNAMSINEVLINPDRQRYELNRMKNSTNSSGLGKYMEFVNNHPGFVVSSSITTAAIVTVQTAFMATQLYLSMLAMGLSQHAQPINGLVSDAAHKFFKESNSVLMVTSLYCAVLRRWIPALMSYMDGQTAAHYKHHYLTLFRIIYKLCEDYNIPFSETLFLMVRVCSSTDITLSYELRLGYGFQRSTTIGIHSGLRTVLLRTGNRFAFR